MVRCTVSSFSNHASVLISVSCLGPGLSHVLLNMGVGYLNYIRKKWVSLIVPPRTVTKQTYTVTGKEYQVWGKGLK